MRIGYAVVGMLSMIVLAVSISGCVDCGDNKQQSVGNVENVSPPASLDDSDAWENDRIYAKSAIKTGPGGWITFHTADVSKCNTRENSQLLVRPDGLLAIQWLSHSGESFCNKRPGQGAQTYGIGENITITMNDPIFGVLLREDESLVRLIDGSATVAVAGLEERFQVGPGQELVIPTEGAPVVRPLTLSEEEWDIVRDLGWSEPTPAAADTPVPNTPTPEPTSTPCPLLEIDGMSAYLYSCDGEPSVASATVEWWSHGGCEPVSGTLRAEYGSSFRAMTYPGLSKSPTEVAPTWVEYATYNVEGASGRLEDEVGQEQGRVSSACLGRIELRYTLDLNDASGQSATHEIVATVLIP